jgi:hypothetical protein
LQVLSAAASRCAGFHPARGSLIGPELVGFAAPVA